jgi:hypothetical protein
MSSDAAPVSEAGTSAEAPATLFGVNLAVLVAIILGLVSTATAWVSFQASLYDSSMAGAYQKASDLSTEAESLYLEGNQQFILDTQVWNRLSELAVVAASEDPDAAADAQATYDTLMFQSVSEGLAAAIEWAEAENQADPTTWTSPLDNEEYLNSLFSEYEQVKAESVEVRAEGDKANNLSDKLGLYTVLLSISLFLLGIAAAVSQRTVTLMLSITGTVVFLVGLVLALQIPVMSL